VLTGLGLGISGAAAVQNFANNMQNCNDRFPLPPQQQPPVKKPPVIVPIPPTQPPVVVPPIKKKPKVKVPEISPGDCPNTTPLW
jgi:hypothetical protein